MAALDPRVWLAMIVGIVVAAFGGYFYGVHSANEANEAAKNKTIVTYAPKVQAKEATTNNDIKGVGNETESKVAALGVRLDDAVAKLGRLRIKSPACDVPTSTASAGTRDATGATAERTNGNRTGEINLDDVAKQVVQLGNDYDAANIRIDELRSLVRVYEKACKVE